jgi:hypothetical protein
MNSNRPYLPCPPTQYRPRAPPSQTQTELALVKTTTGTTVLAASNHDPVHRCKVQHSTRRLAPSPKTPPNPAQPLGKRRLARQALRRILSHTTNHSLSETTFVVHSTAWSCGSRGSCDIPVLWNRGHTLVQSITELDSRVARTNYQHTHKALPAVTPQTARNIQGGLGWAGLSRPSGVESETIVRLTGAAFLLALPGCP